MHRHHHASPHHRSPHHRCPPTHLRGHRVHVPSLSLTVPPHQPYVRPAAVWWKERKRRKKPRILYIASPPSTSGMHASDRPRCVVDPYPAPGAGSGLPRWFIRVHGDPGSMPNNLTRPDPERQSCTSPPRCFWPSTVINHCSFSTLLLLPSKSRRPVPNSQNCQIERKNRVFCTLPFRLRPMNP